MSFVDKYCTDDVAWRAASLHKFTKHKGKMTKTQQFLCILVHICCLDER